MSHACDVTHGMGLSAVLDRYDASGRDLVLRSMQAVYGLVGQSLPMLWFFDCGLPLHYGQGFPGLVFCIQLAQEVPRIAMRCEGEVCARSP
jgi:hypothetical protein